MEDIDTGSYIYEPYYFSYFVPLNFSIIWLEKKKYI